MDLERFVYGQFVAVFVLGVSVGLVLLGVVLFLWNHVSVSFR